MKRPAVSLFDETPTESVWLGGPTSFGILALVTALVYLPTLSYGFVLYDDPIYVYNNPLVRGGWTWDAAWSALVEFRAANWHPLVWWSFMLEIEWFGCTPGVMHATNVLLHVINTLLLGYWLRALTGSGWRAWLVAAMFALHPLHVESVAWITERKDVLCLCFWLLSMWCYTNWAKRGGAMWYLLSLVMFAVGLLAKPMIVTLPCVLLLLDFWPLQRWRGAAGSESPADLPTERIRKNVVWRVVWLVFEKLPFFALTAGSCVLTFLAQLGGGAVQSVEKLPLLTRLAQSLVAYGEYLRLTVWPWGLAVFYPPPTGGQPVVVVVLYALLLLVISVVCLMNWRVRPWLIVGWLWYLGILVPMIGLVQVGSQAYADRYMYVPMIGLGIMLVWSLPNTWNLRAPGVTGVVAGLLLLAWTGLTVAQVQVWQTTETLFTHAIWSTGPNYVAELTLGTSLHRSGRSEEAIPHLQAARKLNDREARAAAILADVAMQRGLMPAAGVLLTDAERINANDSEVLLARGMWLSRSGAHEPARQRIEKYIAAEPESAAGHALMGIVLIDLKQVDAAETHLRKALQIDPDDVSAWTSLGRLELQRGRFDQAREALSQVLQRQPVHPEATISLAIVDLQQQQPGLAVQRLQSLLQNMPGYPPAVQLLRSIQASAPR